ncbi:hypothetical protein QL285_059734 [Trifolium repens]|nr:hypothetical protein QL285_059734 [Trifolium repens]
MGRMFPLFTTSLKQTLSVLRQQLSSDIFQYFVPHRVHVFGSEFDMPIYGRRRIGVLTSHTTSIISSPSGSTNSST